RVVHATTLFTNALIERRGAKTGLITTHGFRDTLEMRREFKYDLYDLFLDMPNALVPRYLRGEVRERMSFDGSIDTPLDTAELEKVAQHLVNESVESLAIVFLHSYANPTHERQARDILQQRFPDLNISISSEVSPQIREYERMSTTVTNAYVGPMADKYLASFDQRLKSLGISCPLL